MLEEQNALHTLIHQRHLTPSCGGHAPTAERTLDPARMFMESLTPGPELENRLGHSRPMHSTPAPINVRCYSNSDMIVRRSEATLRARKRLMHRSKMHSPFDHFIGANQRQFRDYGPRAPSGVLSVITNSTMSVAGPANGLAP